MSKFKQDITIKHLKNTDVAFKITFSHFSNNEYYLKGYWINIVNPNNHYVIDKDAIIITENEIDNWVQIQ